jgi:predicted O-linked N-acetylglucosamine transferase (SPINDLY family)
MGTPVVTLPSEFLRGRITAGLYQKMAFTDCIARSTEDYIALAVRLGTDRTFRKTMSQSITKKSSLLFEDLNEVRCLETTLLACAGRQASFLP